MPSVLITGCSSGFGLLTALTFARRGHAVFATVRDLSSAGPLRTARDAEGLAISILPLDVRDAASVDAAVSAVLDDGPIDVLVNNAGYVLRSPLEEVDDDEFLDQLDTNVVGVGRLIRAVAPTMRERGSGTIVNVSSLVATVPQPFGGVYAASKAAVSTLSEALHYELATFGVRVVLIEPGPYPTRFQQNEAVARRTRPGSAYWDERERYQAALARAAGSQPRPDPQEVADAVYAAVADERPRFRYVVGGFAQKFAALRRSTELEEFERVLRGLLDWPMVPPAVAK